MARNITDTTGENVVVKNVPVRVELKDESKPSLSGSLNANGHDIVRVGNIQAEKFNGQTMDQAFDTFFGEVKKELDKLADKNHSHKEIAELRSVIDGKADKDHDHEPRKVPTSIEELSGTLSLAKIEGGDKLETLLARELCSSQHAHPAYEKALKTLDDNIKLVAKAVDTKIGPEATQALQQAFNALEDALRSELTVLEKKIPVVPKPEKNVIGIKRIHVPQSGTVQEIVGRDENGAPVKVQVIRSGKEIKVGDSLAADDILTLSPSSASVRLRLV